MMTNEIETIEQEALAMLATTGVFLTKMSTRRDELLEKQSQRITQLEQQLDTWHKRATQLDAYLRESQKSETAAKAALKVLADAAFVDPADAVECVSKNESNQDPA